MLAHTGSTFALSAALVSHSSQVFLYGLPKESANYGDHAWHAQYLPGCIPVQTDGSLLFEDSSRLVELIAERMQFRRKLIM
jgi:hypothetical protein